MKTTPHRILIVDDEVNLLDALSRIFKMEGYEVITSQNALEAIDLLKKGQPVSLILSDQKMPGMEGVRFLETVKEISPLSTRVIMTGLQDAALMERSTSQAGVFRFLTKPVDLDALLEVVALGVQRYETLRDGTHED
ncbi:MAG: response regulator [Nitrospinae bacterium]|nr:response regulator [Nitrospinota bacterium]